MLSLCFLPDCGGLLLISNSAEYYDILYYYLKESIKCSQFRNIARIFHPIHCHPSPYGRHAALHVVSYSVTNKIKNVLVPLYEFSILS